MFATLVLYLAPALAALIAIVAFLINRRQARRLAKVNGALQAAAAAAHRNIKRRQMLDADLEHLQEQHRKETLDAQTPDADRADFDNDWLPEPRPGAGPGSDSAAPARAPGAAGGHGR